MVKMQVAAQPVRLSVVIPTSDRSETLATTLEWLRAQEDVGGLAEIVVVDNGSTDDTPRVLADAAEGPGLPVRWLREPRPGPAAARNAGVRAADGDLILFLGDDVRPAGPGLLAGHLRAHRNGEVGVLGRVRWDPAAGITTFMEWLDSSGVQFDYGRLEPGPVDPARHLYTAHVSLPKALLREVGGFDEGFTTAALEDLDLGLRLSRRGFTLRYEPSLEGLHHHRMTYCESLRRAERIGAAAVYFHAIHGSSAHAAVGGPSVLRRYGLRVTATLLAGSRCAPRLPAPLRAFRWRVTHLGAFARGLSRGERGDVS